ncbi:unnamed protein product (macronuclear) [Paramecium tetraurelia]|uniref:Uncharacterized protein n=1 Tax=Paramecium tetraurelia TaxID=5888 RepID=A0DZC5_PARTE|nr:uncharacterized protein GSPATT00003361001 [Paramecium tetraurelia]CAK88392.1 unnamed protein product [Paramecium tetraurelia]|eukprot:XP_001455789.1 hypothetical protein (macronuclear) [Paramecium tetraurelia strain d4-2]
MKGYEFLRLIQEIGVILNLSTPTISHVITIYKRFTLSNKRQFKKEMVITACFYLVSKIVEDMKRIRDILVIICVVNKMYTLANQERKQKLQANNQADYDEDPIKYLGIEQYENYNIEFFDKFVPLFNNEQYAEWKREVLEAEQHILRIINYDLKNETLDSYQLLLNYLKIFQFEQGLRQMIFDIFQDTFFVDFQTDMTQVDCVKGSIYLGIQFFRMHAVDKQKLLKLKEEFCSQKWWEEFMQISYKQLLLFQIDMLQYYNAQDFVQA